MGYRGIGRETKLLINAVRPKWSDYEESQRMEIQFIGDAFYRIQPSKNFSADRMITMDGNMITTPLQIPFPHMLLRAHFYHTTAAYVASEDAMTMQIFRRVASIPNLERFLDQIWSRFVQKTSSYIKTFPYGEWPMEPAYYDINLQTTSTHKILPVLYVERLFDFTEPAP